MSKLNLPRILTLGNKKPQFGQLFLFGLFLWRYCFAKIIKALYSFEKLKNRVVCLLLWKRGVLGRSATHTGILVLIFVVVIFSAATSGNSLLAQTEGEEEFPNYSVTYIEPVTIISEKPRDQIVEYQIEGGDTISSIAQKFDVSSNTVLWANDLLEDDTIKPGDKLNILPVTGVAHKVASGENIYSIAKKYQADSQAILDFPFNEVGDDLALRVGQTLIVPDGAPPSKPKPPPTQYLAKQQIISQPSEADGRLIWPSSGYISQYFAYYHKAIDIVNYSSPPVVAADAGKVVTAGYIDRSGYGNRVVIDHGNGFTTLYAHLSQSSVASGQYVSKGQKIGTMGSTGRSTAIHLHLEVRKNGVALNPLSFLSR